MQLRTEAVYVSRSVLNDLRALAMCYGTGHGEDILAVSPDALADELLRKALDGIPGIKERAKAIRKALDQITRDIPLNKPDDAMARLKDL